MAILTKEDLLNKIKERIGDDTSDEAISFIEDATDTINDFETKAQGDGVDWKQKYNENDAEWRKRYRDRFFDPDSTDKDNPLNQHKDENEDNSPKTFDELFTNEGGKK